MDRVETYWTSSPFPSVSGWRGLQITENAWIAEHLSVIVSDSLDEVIEMSIGKGLHDHI
jgi:hypothetical protein